MTRTSIAPLPRPQRKQLGLVDSEGENLKQDDNSDILRRYWLTVPKSSAAVG